MSIVLKLLVTLMLGFVGIVYGAWAIQTLWEWFLVPEWADIPETKTLYGFFLLFSVAQSFRVMGVAEWEEDVEQTVQRALDASFATLVAITFILAFGWILS